MAGYDAVYAIYLVLLVRHGKQATSDNEVSAMDYVRGSVAPSVMIGVFRRAYQDFILFFSSARVYSHKRFFSVYGRYGKYGVYFSSLVRFLLYRLHHVRSIKTFYDQRYRLFTLYHVLCGGQCFANVKGAYLWYD